jgi:hypothetical protein
LTEQQKEDENEERGTKEMQLKVITGILSAIDLAAEKLRGIDPDWERGSTVKRGMRVMLHSYEILQQNVNTVDVTFFLDVF